MSLRQLLVDQKEHLDKALDKALEHLPKFLPEHDLGSRSSFVVECATELNLDIEKCSRVARFIPPNLLTSIDTKTVCKTMGSTLELSKEELAPVRYLLRAAKHAQTPNDLLDLELSSVPGDVSVIVDKVMAKFKDLGDVSSVMNMAMPTQPTRSRESIRERLRERLRQRVNQNRLENE